MAKRAIRRILVGTVIRAGRRSVVIIVTAVAIIRRVIVVAVVTSCTIVRNICVSPQQRPEIIVDFKSGRCPTRFGGMAFVAIGWQVQCRMAGVAAVVVILLVATVTVIWCVVVITVVTGCAIIGDIEVRSIDYPEIIVHGKSSRCPTGFCCMAFIAVHGQAKRHVIRVAGVVKLRLVTS